MNERYVCVCVCASEYEIERELIRQMKCTKNMNC